MTLVEAVSASVTAKQAGELYGLKFDRRGQKAVCPWHTDHKPSLSFKGKRCKCFACNNGGDAVDLTAQIFGLSVMDAAKKLQGDFGIGVDVDTASLDAIHARQRAQEKAKAAEMRKYDDLCRTNRQCWESLQAFDQETAWDNPEFVRLLSLYAKTQDKINMWHCGQ